MTEKIKAAILGFGTVGQGVYQSIQSHQSRLKQLLGKEVEVAGILIQHPEKERDVDESVIVTTQFEDILAIPGLQVIFEAIVGEEPGHTYLSMAIEKGIHVITANKVMFARHGQELLKKAKENGVQIGFEATTAGGTPILQTLALLRVNEVEEIQGILNGTSNFILSEMREKKISFHEALKDAQARGYAEADPANDIEGTDAFYKLLILSNVGWGIQPDWETIEKQGITHITSEVIEIADQLRCRVKHVADIKKEGSHLKGFVKPVFVPSTHPFYGVEGVENAVSFQGSLIGRVTIQGPGAGKYPTASAMVEDLIHVLKQTSVGKKPCFSHTSSNTAETEWVVLTEQPLSEPNVEIKHTGKTASVYYYDIAATRETIEQWHQKETILQSFEVLNELALEPMSASLGAVISGVSI